MDAGLTVNDLQTAAKIKELLGKIFLCILDLSLWLAGEITQDFPWFSALHGWWRSSLLYNVVYSTMDSDQDFAAQTAATFKICIYSQIFQWQVLLYHPLYYWLIHHSLTLWLHSITLIMRMWLVRGIIYVLPPCSIDIDDGMWNLNNMFTFNNLDMNFGFADPSVPPTTLLSAHMSTTPTTNNTIATHQYTSYCPATSHSPLLLLLFSPTLSSH